MLIETNSEQIYRHSFIANYYVYTLATKTLVSVSPAKVMHAEISPDGKKVAFLRDNNILYFDLEANRIYPVTMDGERNKIINGSCDWVYEEEFAFTKAWQWSPNSDMIAYYRFDESKVKEFSMSMYGELYPNEYRYKYPKAGEANSEVSIRFFNGIGYLFSNSCFIYYNFLRRYLNYLLPIYGPLWRVDVLPDCHSCI